MQQVLDGELQQSPALDQHGGSELWKVGRSEVTEGEVVESVLESVDVDGVNEVVEVDGVEACEVEAGYATAEEERQRWRRRDSRWGGHAGRERGGIHLSMTGGCG